MLRRRSVDNVIDEMKLIVSRYLKRRASLISEAFDRLVEEGTAAVEEKTDFSVMLMSAGPNKIPVIKVVREITGLGLKEAKDLVDGAPKTVKENATKEQAEEIKKKLTEVGATVELK